MPNMKSNIITCFIMMTITCVQSDVLLPSDYSYQDFIDERLVEHTLFLERKVTVAQKYSGNPIIRNANGVCGIVQRPQGPIQIFYVRRLPRPGEKPHGGRIPLGERTLCYAETIDGFKVATEHFTLQADNRFRKPNVIIARGDYDVNNVPLWDTDRGFGELPVIMFSRGLPGAPDDYLMFSRFSHIFYSSPDGIVWTAHPELSIPDLKQSDTYNNIIFNDKTGNYHFYHRPAGTLHAGWYHANRLIAMVTSKNLKDWDWDAARCVLDTDLSDAPAVPNVKPRENVYRKRGRDVMFERMTVLRYGSLFLGLAGKLDDTRQGYYSTELLHSYDGIEWIREKDKTPFIAPGEFGSWDAGIAGGTPVGMPIIRNGRLIFYYTGSNMSHGYVMKTKDRLEQRHIGAASVPVGRLIGYHAGKTTGEMLTRPMACSGKELTVNADASSGTVRVGIVKMNGAPIPGFALQDCVPLRKDDLAARVSWKRHADLRSLEGQMIRLRFSVSSASIYGFTIR